jgi:molybdate transport system substrate-binding protein
VVWTKGEAAPKGVADLADARFAKIAIANPEHAPYGRAAQQALEKAGVWDAVKPRLVFGENVQQTLQFAQTGNADAAIVALSLAIVTDGGTYLTIDEGDHKPIDQALVVCSRGTNKEGGRQFAAFVNGDEGRVVMRRFGFLLPGEAAAKTP